jgi:single-strand DNA-binding protein
LTARLEGEKTIHWIRKEARTMGSVNKVILVGNLGADPELKYTPSNRPVCRLSVATNEVWKDKDGKKQERTEWHRVNVWGEQAENCSKFLAKGRMVYVEGRLQTRSWDDKEGKKHYSTEVVADRVVFLGGGAESGAGGGGGAKRGGGGKPGWGEEAPASGPSDENGPPPAGDDEIPF